MRAQPTVSRKLSGSQVGDEERGLIRSFRMNRNACSWLVRRLWYGEYGRVTKTAIVSGCKAQDSLAGRQEQVVSIDG